MTQFDIFTTAPISVIKHSFCYTLLLTFYILKTLIQSCDSQMNIHSFVQYLTLYPAKLFYQMSLLPYELQLQRRTIPVYCTSTCQYMNNLLTLPYKPLFCLLVSYSSMVTEDEMLIFYNMLYHG